MYRIETLEKRLDALDKGSNSELVTILLGMLEKKSTHQEQEAPVTDAKKSQVATKPTDQAEVYDTLLSFARRRTII